jgi:diacylglycerol kinase
VPIASSPGYSAYIFAGILLAWRGAHDEIRLRLQWILATLGAIMAMSVLVNLSRCARGPIPAELIDLISNVTFVLAEIGFVYAVFRHRIFDFGLVVNRALIFAIAGAILFGSIQLAHAVASEFLSVDDRNKSVLLSAILALAMYLSFNLLKKAVEKTVDRVFFRSWAEREDDLQRFVKKAHFASDPGALARQFVAAVDRFTDGAGCALFRRQADGSYARQHSTLAGMSERLDANDETVLALPMLLRGQLLAFALLGGAPGAVLYRPDQIAALQSAVHQVGFDFHTTRVDALEHLVAAERQAAATLRAQLDTAMSLARDTGA